MMLIGAKYFVRGSGILDFYSNSANGLRCVIEWETGNISSSHRSMNKLCLVMLAGLIEIGVVILPKPAALSAFDGSDRKLGGVVSLPGSLASRWPQREARAVGSDRGGAR